MNRQLVSLSLAVILELLLAPGANAQTVCSVIGKTVICQSGGPPTVQQQLTPQQGIITTPDGQVTPYTILTPPPPPQLPSLTPAPQAPSVLVIPTPSVSGY